MRFFLLLPLVVAAQDTIRVMAYNLLHYGATPGYCDTRCKDQQLRTIVGFVRPHLIGVNEVGPSAALVRRILDSVLNVNGVTYWRSSLYQNTVSSDIVSALFYDSRRFGWLGQELITTQGGLRDIFAYHLYYKAADLAQTQDTIFVVAIVSHLKAGNASSDAQTRAQAAQAIRQYIQNLPSQRQRFVIEMGDHNLYGDSEAAYQTLTQVLVDPAPAGPWSGNATYAFFHSQSTRVQSLADGGSGGGLNDRFDFIFFAPSCTVSTAKVRYVPASFKVIGQDGLHFGRSLTDSPTPAGYSQGVINALYAMSDHLPVVGEFAVAASPAVVSLTVGQASLPVKWSVEGNTLILSACEGLILRVIDALGREYFRGQLGPNEQVKVSLPAGVYRIQGIGLYSFSGTVGVLP